MDHFYIRRRTNIVDLMFDPSSLDPGGGTNVDGYRIKHASNWDQSFSSLFEFSTSGGRASSIPQEVDETRVPPGYVRYLFDFTDHGLEDDSVQFIRVASLNGGTEQEVSRTLIVLAPSQVGTEHPVLVLRGNAPVAADIDGAARLVLPSTAVDFNIENFGSNEVFIGLGAAGNSELRVPGGTQIGDNRLNVDTVTLRASGSPTEVQLYLVLSEGPSL